ncbi:Exosome RNA helicase MTR4, variant 2 [Clonorchis sinensis]|uniref:Exosome RNA helicase MTR4, variant 2 n=1 Tax=Clonorchis sinensis TaxID=79923 RepID=A0A8T1MDD9_CLOSI|nr:Exosome RNA helicase MTR4, variant 2 [Clonorchis sinensis]
MLLSVLRRGIGMHHGDLIPLLKEVVEILFTKGLIKVLYATETFSMGLNMPARTVLFARTQKFDVRNYRLLTSAEYIQMSGRAGRRGKDDLGTVILMLDNHISSAEARTLLLGEPDRLDSAFYLTNNMVLTLLCVRHVSPEVMLQKSFYNFQNRSTEQFVKELESKLRDLSFPTDVDMKQLKSYVKLKEVLASANRDRRAVATESFLQPDRVAQAVHGLESQVSLNPLASRPDIDQLVDICTQRTLIEEELERARNVLDKRSAIFLELEARKRFLRRLDFCSELDALTFKGRVACEISSGDELMLTELMLDGFFSSLTPAQLAGVLSCFVVKKSFGKHQRTQLAPDMSKALATINASVISRCAIPPVFAVFR